MKNKQTVDTVVISGRINRALQHKIKVYCVKEGLKVAMFMEHALKMYLHFRAGPSTTTEGLNGKS